jgi:hypothetical protein
VSRSKKYRSSSRQPAVVAFSVSYQRDNLLARGLGFEHLRELLIRLARPILRQGASLAYAGHWEEKDDNFTYHLLRLISAEQEDNSLGGADTNLQIGILYNHSAWPHYRGISRTIEAQWINACRIVRVTQEQAGFLEPNIASDAEAQGKAPRAALNAAVTLSEMRRLMMSGMSIPIPNKQSPDIIPKVTARVLLGGRLEEFSGFMPGIFEETLVTLESKRPVYILGGFGGAAEVLADAILKGGDEPPEKLTTAWLAGHNPALASLLGVADKLPVPADTRSTDALLDALFELVKKAHVNPSAVLRTGLSDGETRELLATRSVATAVKLVRQGLVAMEKFEQLPA